MIQKNEKMFLSIIIGYSITIFSIVVFGVVIATHYYRPDFGQYCDKIRATVRSLYKETKQ